MSAPVQFRVHVSDAMLALYPDRLNPSALWSWGAQVLFPPGSASR